MRAAEAVIDRVGRDIKLAIPIGIGKPNLLVNALYAIAEGDPRVRLRIFTGLSLVRPHYKNDLERRFVEPLLDRLFGSYPDLTYTRALRGQGLPPNIEVTEFFLQAGVWLAQQGVQRSYTSLNYSDVAAHLKRIGTNVLAQLVAPEPGGSERVSLSSNTDVTLDMLGYIGERRGAGAPVVFAGEVNANLPYMPGEAEIARTEFDVMLEPDAPHYALFAPPKEPVSLADYAMALHAASLVKDGGTLQIGIGTFADALAHALILRHTDNATFRSLLARLGPPLRADAELGPFEHGLYGVTEMLVDAFLALRRAGILRRRAAGPGGARPALVHAGFFVGSRAFYQELREMPRQQLEEIAMTAISFTNTLYREEAGKRAHRPHARFVNTAMTATLLGTASSDALADGRVVSGVGGQHDLVAMAHALEGARSIIAVRATRRLGRRATSNILWSTTNTTLPRQLRDIVVTEYGIADLRGLSDRDCIARMLEVADQAFQSGLQADAERSGKLERGFALPAHAQSNSAARIQDALGPARREGLLPPFPLGTEMTEVEQTLTGPLAELRSAGPLDLIRALLAGAIGAPNAAEQVALERLSLQSPAHLQDRALRALVIGAMRRAR